MIIPFEKFTGEFPRYSAKVLPDNAAASATDCDFVAGTLRGLKANDPVAGINGAGVKSVFVYDGGAAAGFTFTWAEDTDAVRSPVVSDAYSRFYWANNTSGFKVSYGDTNGSLLSNQYKVGVPRPTGALTVASGHPLAFSLEDVSSIVFTLYDERADGRTENPVIVGPQLATTATSATYSFVARTPQEEFGYVPGAPDQLPVGLSVCGNFPIAGSETQAQEPTAVRVPLYTYDNVIPYAALTAFYPETVYAYYKTDGAQPRRITITVHGTMLVFNPSTGVYDPTVRYTTATFYQLNDADGNPTFWYCNKSTYGAPSNTNEGEEASPFIGPLLVLTMTRADGSVLEAKIREDAADTSWPPELPGYTSALTVTDHSTTQKTFTLRLGVESSSVEVRAYTYTYVNVWGEEGAPADPLEVKCVPSARVVLRYVSPGVGYAPITKVRVYRTGTGATAAYLYVGEISLGLNTWGNNTFEDTVKTAELGHTLDTMNYYPPDQALRGIRVMANGIMVGFKGNEVHFSEPYLPYAWNPNAIKPLPSKVVGICPVEGGLFVTTTTSPYMITGAAPEYMTDMRVNAEQAGVSKGSVVAAGGGVVYATNDGLVQVQGVAASLEVSQRFFTREKWRELYGGKLDKIRINVHDGALLVWFADGTLGFVLRMDEAALSMTEITTPIYAAFTHPLADAIYVSTGTAQLQVFASGSTRKTFSWTSKNFTVPAPTNFGCLQVFGSGTVTYTVTDAVGILSSGSVVLTNEGVVARLPSGRRSVSWQLTLSGASAAEVTRAFLASSPSELQSV